MGQHAVEQLGLSDGGSGYKIGTGMPILPAWRTWARPIVPEIGPAFEAELEETELAHDSLADADDGRSREYQRWLRSANRKLAAPAGGCSCGGAHPTRSG